MSHYTAIAAPTGPILADLRSDTVTQPCSGMRDAMARAEVGDDVYGDDPNVNRLEATLAERLGKEAALFAPSGTQSNLLAMLAHCGRGEEVIAGEAYHVIRYEAAGASVLGGVALHALPVAEDGALEADDITAAIKEDDSHHPISRLLSLENTHYGRAVPLPRMQATVEAGRAGGLSLHLDGARFFNAITALGCSETDLAGPFDTVSICLSKGLGAPVGSVLVGPADLIARARRMRKMLGGGMRQAGVLAAAGLYALEHNAPRLAEDHARAEALAAHLRGLGLGDVTQATNMVFLTPRDGLDLGSLADHGLRVSAPEPAMRLVMHRDIDDAGFTALKEAFAAIA
ncbi:low-specificity L-threonine aldolase [Gymnodinialimonas ceratoperidinii]|uniref:Low-specificity L-threonine aldolase n=1 Tax=Gymnodinialimonas ceratoperidinii TaxID=2856823 RepID=A0A8F6U0M0_9RHOB|nr:low-specificity L-threonine aldolase [Gymnodinialimonas ceratoperidinii]QXT41176.1 low-specificity L-threonine aldolase [Gymnodinialimonas ceratoperidinii]